MTVLVCAAFFVLYAVSLSPALAPYRDAGELASAAATLSVAHPPSYPSYVLLGKLFLRAVPFGNPAYRLGLLSAACAALSCAAVFSAARRRGGLWAGLAAALLLGLNPVFWSVARVQEMYALGALAAAALFSLADRLSERFEKRAWLAFCFLAGLALTNRLDLLLWAPGLLWLALAEGGEPRAAVWAAAAFLLTPALQAGLSANWPILPLIAATVWLRRPSAALPAAACAAAGLSLYAFLPVRSAGVPWLDWNHPAAFSNFLDSLLRTRYGGTLDLISKNYATGALFFEGLKLYAEHLLASFGAAGLALAAAGAWLAAKESPRRFLGAAVCFWWAGPVFLLMANLPPNPHANAIVEPHYLLADLILVFWAAGGVAAAARARPWAGPALAGVLALAPLARGTAATQLRRESWFSADYVRGVLRSAPPRAAVVAKKDVQLYSLWAEQILLGRRTDARVAAQGLSGTPWYQAGWRRADPSFGLVSLSDAAAWRSMAAVNGGLFMTADADMPPEISAESAPRGLLASLGLPKSEPAPWWTLDAPRGRYEYDGQPDFFTSDLVDARAQALSRAGATLALAGRREEARPLLLRAWAMRWDFPEPVSLLAWAAFSEGKLEEAARLYAFSTAILEDLLALSAEYRSLPPVVAGVRRGLAEALMHRGVIADKLGRRDEAERFYALSLERHPLAQAHYNLAVLYWGRDWARVERELQAALAVEPGHAESRRYFAQLKAKLSTGR